jgi:hypothetical protein
MAKESTRPGNLVNPVHPVEKNGNVGSAFLDPTYISAR